MTAEPGEEHEPAATTRRSRRKTVYVGSEEVETGMAERLTFYSDAVVAIAMTLLALELPVPDGSTAAEFWQAAKDSSREYFAFLLSFVVIASYWGTHHRLFRFIHRIDDRMRLLTMFWLFGIVVLPFFTKVIAEPGGDGPDSSEPSRFALYAAAQVLASGAFALMVFHAQSHKLFRSDTPRGLTVSSYWRSATLAAGFLISIPVFFVWSRAWILWIVLPIVLGATGRFAFLRRRTGG
jgi:uncharacterized membrane protein